MYVDVPGVFRI